MSYSIVSKKKYNGGYLYESINELILITSIKNINDFYDVNP